MAKAKTITVAVEIRVSRLKEMIKLADYKIKNKAAFDKLINSASFQKDLASDIVGVWVDTNEDNEGDIVGVVEGLFGDVVEEAECDW